jgi:pimeloyl-ACP methyl ester carboxylesterase
MSDWLMTRDDVRLDVRRWPSRAAGPAAVVVLVHGFGATKDDESVVAVAEELAAAGHHVVSYTGRGHGESGGLCTLGDLEHLDVEAAVEGARSLGDRVVLVGTSMGAVAVLRHAADADIDGVVTVSSPGEWRMPRTVQSAGAAMLTQLPVGRWLARRFLGVRLAAGWSGATSPVELAATITSPHVIVHGTGDRFIRWSEATRLHDAAAEPRRLVLVDDMGHAYMPESRPVVVEAVDWVLAHDRGPRLPPASSTTSA